MSSKWFSAPAWNLFLFQGYVVRFLSLLPLGHACIIMLVLNYLLEKGQNGEKKRDQAISNDKRIEKILRSQES